MSEQVVLQARTWLNTPFHHQQRVKGQGTDCAQLVIGVGIELGLIDESTLSLNDYGRKPNPKRILAHLERYMERSDTPKVGGILWMGFKKDLPMHLAIITKVNRDKLTIIHAYSEPGKVVETLMPDWWWRTIDSFWKYRGLNVVVSS